MTTSNITAEIYSAISNIFLSEGDISDSTLTIFYEKALQKRTGQTNKPAM